MPYFALVINPLAELLELVCAKASGRKLWLVGKVSLANVGWSHINEKFFRRERTCLIAVYLTLDRRRQLVCLLMRS
jgi:hypothetical protein